ncbi:MAG: S-layer homology domain-containing protein, partial [Crenarchaeota archaeon]|nr:S-layer homology domain-containing protein [Thermoproteota archaeon]
MSDIDGHEYEDSIMKMVQAGLMSPYPDGEFRPEGNVRRSEFATVIARFLELQNTDLSELRTLTHTINDLTDDAWYYSYMCIAINLSILQPDDSNMVYPDSWITTDYLSSNTIEIIYNSIALRIMAPDDNSEFYFPGINVLFNREIVMPGDLSKIHIYDGDTEIAISHVEPSGWPGELQISSDVIELDKTYKLVVESNLISDLQGIYYDEEIVIHFKYVEAPLAIDDGYTPPYYSFPGLNIKFNKDIVVPEDWTKIHLYNDNDIEIEITSISTSGYPQELQISSDAIEPDKIYRLVIEANVIKDLQGTYYDQEIVINFKYINPLQSGIGYVLDTADATPGLAGDAPLVMLLLKDGTRKVFEVDRDYYSIQDQNDVVTKDGIWLIQPGTAMLFNTDADEIIIKAEKRDMIESDESRLTENGYVDGKKVHESAFLLYYIEQNSYGDENYKIATLEELQGKDLSGIKYTLDSEGQIDFLMIQYYLPDEYGVITNTFQNDSITGFGINMIVDGSEIEKNSIDFSNYDIRKLYHIEEDINGNIVALTAVAPDIVI